MRRAFEVLAAAWCCLLVAAPGLAERPSALEERARELGATSERFIVEEHVTVPMRDRVRLSTAVIRPRVDRRVPTILVRTPYAFAGELKDIFRTFFEHDYAVVLQHERGTHWSEGDFHILGNAGSDGYDTLNWIAGQSWSNGRVGTYGCSSSGENQLELGSMEHPAHRAMIPMSAGAGIGSIPGVTSQGLFYKNGVPVFAPWIGWYAYYGHTHRPELPAGIDREERRRVARAYDATASAILGNDAFDEHLQEAIRGLPSGDVMARAGVPRTDFDAFLRRSPASPEWESGGRISAEDVGAIPTLHVNAWGDVGPYETLKLFEFQQHHDGQYLVMAPTAHCDMLKASEDTIVGDRPVGDGRFDYPALYLRWFDRHLKNRQDDFDDVSKVRVFLMGGDRWLTGDTWPLEDTVSRKLYLRGDGRANSMYGDGRLSRDAPGREPHDEFVADPDNPVPSMGGGCCDRRVFRDQAAVEARHDVLVYSTPVLEEGISVVGEVRVVLYVSSSARGGDIALKLVDVYPDGTAYNLHDTMYRLRYRDGFDSPAPLEPGAVYRMEITGLVTGNHFGPGHRLRLEIAGSNFPNYERNMNTGGSNYDESRGVVARTRIHHDERHPSHLVVTLYEGDPVADLP